MRYFVGVGLGIPTIYVFRFLKGIHHFDMQQSREKGSMTRTWFAVKDQPIFAWAGMWRISDEWGAVYSGMMTDCNEAIRPVHDRMPVLLHPDEYDQWLHGSLDDVIAFRDRCFPDELIQMNRTDELWSRRRPAQTILDQL